MKIANLVEQAKKSVPHGLTPDKWIDVYNKNFANLIVRECASIYSKIDNGNEHLGTDDYLEALQKHFGVDK